MKIVGRYSFAGGGDVVPQQHQRLLKEIEQAIYEIDADQLKTKESNEKTMKGSMLYSPVALNKEFKRILTPKGWNNYKVNCDYPTQYYVEGYNPVIEKVARPFRDMDFVKGGLGVEVQFGKYAFMVYDVAAKMTIFRKLNVINAGIEIVPIKEFAAGMSTGVSYFEQFCWDLDQRGRSDIDTPVLVLGITSD
jgi:hypothetical protein